jgi:hypothetical protein
MADNDLKDRRHKLLFGVQRSVRYHARRRAHFDRINRATVALSLMFGSATFATLLGNLAGRTLLLALAAIVTALSALDLVLGTERRAREHHDFERRWITLEREMIRAGDCGAEQLAEFEDRRLSIEADEEPPLRILDVLCHNELVRATQSNGTQYKIGPIQRMLAQWIDWRPDSIKRSA